MPSPERPEATVERQRADAAAERSEPAPLDLSSTRERIVVTTIGLVVGVLGGAVGLILGSLRMPALLRFTNEVPQRLVGSNLAAGVLVGAAGAAGHITGGTGGFDGQLFMAGAVASVPGAWLGAKLTGLLSTRVLVRAIAWIVLAVAVVMAVEVIAGGAR